MADGQAVDYSPEKFLGYVERLGSDPLELYNSLQLIAQLTDDFSMARIRYKASP